MSYIDICVYILSHLNDNNMLDFEYNYSRLQLYVRKFSINGYMDHTFNLDEDSFIDIVYWVDSFNNWKV